MPRWLLDQHGGVLSTFEDHEDGIVIRETQDVTSALDKNKARQNMGRHRTQDGSLELVASIPNIITTKWLNEDGVNWLALPKKERRAYLARKLNDPDWRYLRTGGGRY